MTRRSTDSDIALFLRSFNVNKLFSFASNITFKHFYNFLCTNITTRQTHQSDVKKHQQKAKKTLHK